MNILKPPHIMPGDTFGIIAPASPVADHAKIDRGVRYLEGLGYRVKLGKEHTKVHGYLAGTDRERVNDLHDMFRDRSVKAVLCARGGYGTPRLLSMIDYALIRRNPKLFIGFSDITALHMALWKKCRLVTFHGPMLATDMADGIDPLTEQWFWDLLTSGKPPREVVIPPDVVPERLRSGKARGYLLGGNLSLLAALVGTPFLPDFRGSVLFVEEIGEEPYRVDRMLQQLILGKVLHSTRGLLWGQFTDCSPKDPSLPSLSVTDLLHEVSRQHKVPSLANLPFGHIGRKMTIPVGVRCQLDADAKKLSFLEPAVR